jgi:hypothetical protein
MRSVPRVLVVILFAACMAGCASTTIKDTWKDPSVSPESMQFKKVLVVAMLPEASRRVAEDEMVRHVRTQAVPSYTLISSEELKDVDAAKRKVKEQGFDGAIIMRMVGQEQRVSYVPGSYPGYYGSFYGYYGYAGSLAYDPGYVTTDTIVNLETNVYSLREDKLLWSGLSETFNPKNLTTMIDGVASATARQLEKEGLLPKETGKKEPRTTS